MNGQRDENPEMGEVIEGTCFECLAVGPCHEHHVVPKSLGGTKTLPLCRDCHGKVHGLNFTNHGNLVRIGLERRKAETGRYGGPHPYGQLSVEEKCTLDIMLALRKDEMTVREISDELNRMSRKTRNGRPWHYSSVAKILSRHLNATDDEPGFS